MRSKWMSMMGVALLAVLFALAGCAEDNDGGTSGFAPDAGQPDRGRVVPEVDDGPGACRPRLEAVEGDDLTPPAGADVDLWTRLVTCDGDPVPSYLVDYAIDGDPVDSALVSRTAVTDESGEAFVRLAVGHREATFSVVATAEGAESLVFLIAVAASPSGTVEVVLNAPAELAFDAFRAHLFASAGCSGLGPFELGAPLQTAPSVPTTASRPVFQGVPVGTGYAVVVLADRDGGVLGYGCADGVGVAADQVTEVPVTVGEIEVLFHGVYDLDNLFDLSNALSPSVATTLQVLDELSDDDDLYGNVSTEDFGLDPAAFILDFVYREFCCWEALGTNPTFDSCQAQEEQHPYGDLSDLYLHNFAIWGGAQPLVPLMCGALGVGANEALQEILQDLIEESVPDVALRLVEMTGDLARAVTDMHIQSELIVHDAALSKAGHFSHRLVTMTVELHDLDGVAHEFVFDLFDAGLSNLSFEGETHVEEGHVLVIPEHSFRLDFGRLLLYIYNNGLLPLLDCDPDRDGTTEPCESTADLLATWINCETFGGWLASEVGFLDAETFADICDAGVDIAGLVIDSQISGSIDAESVITLSGTCEAGAVDERRLAIELSNGDWDGVLVEDEASIGTFDGTFTGLRTSDP